MSVTLNPYVSFRDNLATRKKHEGNVRLAKDAVLPRLQVSRQTQAPHSVTMKSDDVVADRREHSADLVIASLR